MTSEHARQMRELRAEKNKLEAERDHWMNEAIDLRQQVELQTERLRLTLERAEKAEDEVDNLRRVLLRWEQYGCPDCGGDCASANPPVACCIMQETRDALKGSSK